MNDRNVGISDPHSFTPGRKVDQLETFRQKYAAERDKRLTKEGSDQFQAIGFTGKFSEFDTDPYVDGPRQASPMSLDLDVLVVGAGFMGMTAGIELEKIGVSNYKILDVAADFGGTWYWNRYPGVRCDVESYIYLPYLEETGYVPTERYIRGSEIFAYCQSLARQNKLYDHAVFQTRVTDMEWNEDAARWTVRTDNGDEFRARFVATQSGLFTRPHLPGIPGIESFAGHSFHTSRWDFDYTGGDDSGNLNGLRGKKVAIIGTGATGLQVIPQVAEYADELVVYQRTPTQVMPRQNAATDVEWFASLKPGWHSTRRVAFDKCVQDHAVVSDVDDGWVRFAKYQMEAVFAAGGESPTVEQYVDALERSDYEWNEMLRARVDAVVTDESKAAKLKTYYRTMCKRPGFSDEYLPAFNKESVDVVDTATTPIERITETGIVTDGQEREFDLIIFATGFQGGRTWSDKAGYDVVGRNGNRLSKKFANGLRTLHGFLSRDFPNLFLLGFTQTATVSNIAHLIDEQAVHMVYVIDQCRSSGARTIEPTAEAEEAWGKVMSDQTATRTDWLTTCTPGLYNNEGKITDNRNPLVSGVYVPGFEYFELLEKWRADGELDGLVTEH
ncbi:NAD(P)/FAD-dependent oxidoreductase [Gordonia sp. HY002]|uniref:flavin-containing monooxygenase n=1 Tax=Gordonia zhenghanii TaxID=2911516 RepID=UPI001EF0FC5F|nr:NAD(P)/FAD-dependent oxidoreductase [Gordonia zhenghanii]MCF8568769.1 NAD(P)/FAD-dependent oxidoreductase [Gordonia zhenghanii]MCF8606102.1 NAD(P)/FAD-dependent oxidoreductase [Gordonia zhenghanii]